MTVTKQKRHPRRKTRFSGIVRAARNLGVTREHLYLVITNRRNSPRLAARYLKLMRKKFHRQPSANSNTL